MIAHLKTRRAFIFIKQLPKNIVRSCFCFLSLSRCTDNYETIQSRIFGTRANETHLSSSSLLIFVFHFLLKIFLRFINRVYLICSNKLLIIWFLNLKTSRNYNNIFIFFFRRLRFFRVDVFGGNSHYLAPSTELNTCIRSHVLSNLWLFE